MSRLASQKNLPLREDMGERIVLLLKIGYALIGMGLFFLDLE